MFYIMNEEGKLAKATEEQVLDGKSQLYNEKGEEIVRPKAEESEEKGKEVTAANLIPNPLEDPIKTLTGQLTEIAGGMEAIKDKIEQDKEAIAAYKEAKERGFPIPSAGAGGSKLSPEDEELFKGYDLAAQGRYLMEKFNGVNTRHKMSEEARQEMAKFFVLLNNVGQKVPDPDMQKAFRSRYMKTVIGDSGNTFVIPDIVDSELFHFERERSVALQYCRIWDMTSEKLSFPAETASSTVAWGNTTSESEPTSTEVELSAQELSAYAAVKDMTLADARTDIVSWIADEMAEACALELDNQVFNGTGDPVSGLLSAKCGYSVVMGSGSTSFSNLTSTHMSDMIADLDGRKKDGAAFYGHGLAMHYIRDLKDDNNRPIFLPVLSAPTNYQVYGFPVREVIKSQSTDGSGTAFLLFGNLKYFAIGRRLGSTSLQVDPYGLWTTNRTRFKIYQRWGLRIALANGFVRLMTASE